MTIIAFPPSARSAVIALSLALGVAVLSGCSNGDAESSAQDRGAAVTAQPTGASDTAVTRNARIAKSDVLGRRFDLGTIVSVEAGGAVPVIIFDRWTARGVADSTLAAKGVPISVHSDAPYRNLNSTITYRIPVVQGAIFTYRHCVAVGQPPQQESSTLEDFARLDDQEKVVLLTLDQHGRVFSAQNDPAC